MKLSHIKKRVENDEQKLSKKNKGHQPYQRTQDQDAPHETSPHRYSIGDSPIGLQHQDQDMAGNMCSMNL